MWYFMKFDIYLFRNNVRQIHILFRHLDDLYIKRKYFQLIQLYIKSSSTEKFEVIGPKAMYI